MFQYERLKCTFRVSVRQLFLLRSSFSLSTLIDQYPGGGGTPRKKKNGGGVPLTPQNPSLFMTRSAIFPTLFMT